MIYVTELSVKECAEKCVEAFNTLTETEISEICKGIINYVKEGGLNEGFELPALDNALDILNHCWFVALYVNMMSEQGEISLDM